MTKKDIKDLRRRTGGQGGQDRGHSQGLRTEATGSDDQGRRKLRVKRENEREGSDDQGRRHEGHWGNFRELKGSDR